MQSVIGSLPFYTADSESASEPDTFKMAFDKAMIFTPQALPTPIETPRQTLSRNSSRHTRRRRSSSPPSMPRTDRLQHDSKDEATNADQDQDMSSLDPRRFTPNLHASLVGQILTLQREVECRNNTVGNLEEFLHITKAENEKLTQEIKDQANENRSISKQMRLLESTTLTALGEIARERDDATENLAEARHCLQISKTKIRSQEEEAKNTKIIWDKEKQNWDVEKRNMETKVHLVEGRLRIVLAEIAATQSDGYGDPGTTAEFEEGSQSIYHQGSVPTSSRSDSDDRDLRFSDQNNATNEVSDYLTFRASTLSGLDGFGGSQLDGSSLADELNGSGFDGHEEDETANDISSLHAVSGEARCKPRCPSMQSLSQDQKAWKLLGLLSGPTEHAIAEDLMDRTATIQGDTEASIQGVPIGHEKVNLPTKETKAQYLDSATQFSPPSSPKLTPRLDLKLVEKVPEKAPVRRNNIANKSRKRISVPLTEQTTPPKLVCPPISPMVSAGCQTVERPLSPPLTPMIVPEPPASSSSPSEKSSAMTSSCTQTEDAEQALLASASSWPKHSSVNVPFIEIHPPASRPPSSHNSVVLPPRTKSAGCQASIELPVSLRSISVQTDAVVRGELFVESATEIVPNVASQSLFSTSSVEKIDERSRVPPQTAQKIPHRPPPSGSSRPRIKPSHSAPLLDPYPGNNDSGPLSDKMTAGLRRPVRNGSLFAGFDSPCKDTHLLKDFDLSSDDDSAAVAPIRKTLSKVQNSWKLVPQTDDKSFGHLNSARTRTGNLDLEEAFDPWLASPVPLEELAYTKSEIIPNQTRFKATASSNSITQLDILQAPHKADFTGLQAQERGSSAQQTAKKIKPVVIPPPFPVPTRSSSRRMPISVSEGAQSPSPYSTTFFSNTRKRGVGRPPSKNPLRKVRSAAAVPRFGRINGKARTSHETLSPSTLAFDRSQLPEMPKMNITSRCPSGMQEVQQTTHALPPDSLSGPASIETPGQSTSVVDAIAQTMVGEWMWKYVRKRKSFGITDDADFDEKGNGNGIRHKRWVWLAPYERAVIWSSKQPTSGPALMGKNGRKRKFPGCVWLHHLTPIQLQSSRFSMLRIMHRFPRVPTHRHALVDQS